MRRVQYFNGIKFSERGDGYYEADESHKNILMHRYVWSYYNGDIPKGYVIHHKDSNRGNNDITNLECLSNSQHSYYHGTNKPKERLEKDIENLKKAQIEAAKWHKSEAGREWHRENAKKCIEEGKLNIKVLYTCENCGKEFIGVKRRAKHKFCSGACAQYYRRHNGLNNITRICVICGKEFITDKYGNTKTCSRSCGMKLAHINNPTNWRTGQ